ncbi:MAG: lytic transglycosylase domain-containing protein [Patescibacteria group bacterium]|nr:lytic transglycosylase domain-containing protein [Patescibacteria group bacterium]
MKKHYNKLFKSFNTLSLMSKTIAVSLVLASTPLGTFNVQAKDEVITPQAGNSSVRVDFTRANALYIDEKKINSFNLVESENSKYEREQREKAEQEKQAQSRAVVARDSRPAPVDVDLATKRALAKKAAAKYGIDWKILEAVWQVESGKAWNTSGRSYAGAQGPMQFMRGTWNAYAVDGNGDGNADINNAEDAVYAGANYLAAGGAAEGNVDGALFNYNHAQWYVDKVKGIAVSITE